MVIIPPWEEQQTPGALTLADTDASVSSILFADKDLDDAEIGGHVTWTPPTDASLVSHYLMYLAAAGELITRYRIGIDIPVGTNWILIPPETAEGSYERVVVFTKSTLAEQTTPVAITFVDNEATVQTIVYPDEEYVAMIHLSLSIYIYIYTIIHISY